MNPITIYIYICEKYFTNETAKFCKKLFEARKNYPKFAGCKTLFWSDIRTDSNPEGDNPGDLDIVWNSAMMYNWLRLSEPDFAMLKFRTPYLNPNTIINFDKYRQDFDLCAQLGNPMENEIKKTGNFKFLKGEIYHQAWHGRISTETRLWINGDDIKNNVIKVYDVKKYEETLFYYNSIRRTSMLHENPLADVNLRFDHCGDCALEAHIWLQYKKLDPDFDINYWFVWLNDITRRDLGRCGHGFLFPCDH